MTKTLDILDAITETLDRINKKIVIVIDENDPFAKLFDGYLNSHPLGKGYLSLESTDKLYGGKFNEAFFNGHPSSQDCLSVKINNCLSNHDNNYDALVYIAKDNDKYYPFFNDKSMQDNVDNIEGMENILGEILNNLQEQDGLNTNY
jgi:hypothetical protein